jgi:hypothetical protein
MELSHSTDRSYVLIPSLTMANSWSMVLTAVKVHTLYLALSDIVVHPKVLVPSSNVVHSD